LSGTTLTGASSFEASRTPPSIGSSSGTLAVPSRSRYSRLSHATSFPLRLIGNRTALGPTKSSSGRFK